MSKSENELVVHAKPASGIPNEITRSNWADRLSIIAPDLKLELPPDWITPAPPIIGQSATIRFRIRNIGRKPALDFTTHLYMDRVQVESWQFHHIDSEEDPEHQYQPLQPGQATKTFEYVTPRLKGTHYFRWVVDTENEILEQSESNNIFESTITSVSRRNLPDLVARVIEPAGPVEIGQKANLKVRITNQGQTDVAKPFWVFVKSNGMHIITQEIPKLMASESIILEQPISSVSKKKTRIDVEVDTYSEINESNKNNNTHSMELEFAAVELEVIDCRIIPSLQNHGWPVITFDIRNIGKIDATRPFSVHLYEIAGSTIPQVEKIQLSTNHLPRAGETLSITLPIKGWDFETAKIYVATKAERHFVLQVDPEFVYQKTLASNSMINITFSLYEVYKPWLQSSADSAGDLPEAYFFTFPKTNLPDGINRKTFAYIEISDEPGSGGGSGSSSGGNSGFDLLKPFIETAKWFKSIFTDETDDRVRDTINRLKQQEIVALNDDQLVDMIKKLFDGPTLDEDENAVNKVLDALPANRFSNLVAKLGGLSAIDDEIDGPEWKNTLKIVSAKGQQLPLQGKLDLIKGLLETTTYDAEEKTIIDLVKSMSAQQRWEMLQKPGFSKDDFDDEVDGDEWDKLKKLLDQAKPVLKNETLKLLGIPEVSKIDFELAGIVINSDGIQKIRQAIENGKIKFVHDPFLNQPAQYTISDNTIHVGLGSISANDLLKEKLFHELIHAVQDLTPGTKAKKYVEAAAYVGAVLFYYYTHETEIKNGSLTVGFPSNIHEEAWKVGMTALKKKKLTPNDYKALLKALELLYWTDADDMINFDGI